MKVRASPLQPLSTGVTVIVAVIADAVAFVAVKDAIFPVPPADRPTAVLLFVHEYVVPAIGLEKFIAAVLLPVHSN